MEARNIKLQAYLHSLDWETLPYTSRELEIKMAAALLRYLYGMTEIAFVLGLAEAIQVPSWKTT